MKTTAKIDQDKPEPRLELRNRKMKTLVKFGSCASLLTMFMLAPAQAAVFVQCPGDTDGDATWTGDEVQPRSHVNNPEYQVDINDPDKNPLVKCMHLTGSDGFANMGDGRLQYIFGFGDVTGTPPADVGDVGILNAHISAPTIVLEQDQEFYLSLTNTGMVNRPDLFDPHTVHFHGFPNASSVFDGVPDASISINMGATLTYYYNIQEPGTYLYHCHVEAAEHMQMGMQGNLYVKPRQNGQTFNEFPDGTTGGTGRSWSQFVYNDGDGSPGYDVEMPLQITGFDAEFHDASMNTQPLPFADMKDTYHMFNGRGYPATVLGGDYTLEGNDFYIKPADNYVNPDVAWPAQEENGNKNSQPYSSRQTVAAGEKLLLRITNLSITKFHTVTALGLPMRVIGQGGRELTEKYDTASVNLGGGEAFDVVIDTLGVPAGTYFVYITELNELSNGTQAFGGPMTEIVVQ